MFELQEVTPVSWAQVGDRTRGAISRTAGRFRGQAYSPFIIDELYGSLYPRSTAMSQINQTITIEGTAVSSTKVDCRRPAQRKESRCNRLREKASAGRTSVAAARCSAMRVGSVSGLVVEIQPTRDRNVKYAPPSVRASRYPPASTLSKTTTTR